MWSIVSSSLRNKMVWNQTCIFSTEKETWFVMIMISLQEWRVETKMTTTMTTRNPKLMIPIRTTTNRMTTMILTQWFSSETTWLNTTTTKLITTTTKTTTKLTTTTTKTTTTLRRRTIPNQFNNNNRNQTTMKMILTQLRLTKIFRRKTKLPNRNPKPNQTMQPKLQKQHQPNQPAKISTWMRTKTNRPTHNLGDLLECRNLSRLTNQPWVASHMMLNLLWRRLWIEPYMTMSMHWWWFEP